MKEVVKLTAEQKNMVRSVPGLAEQVAFDVARRFGQIRPMKEMVTSAHYGIAIAAQSYEPDMGTFKDWAYFKAMWTILDDARADRRQRDVIAAGRLVAIEFLGLAVRFPSDDDVDNTEEQDRAELAAYKGGVLAAFLQGVALMPAAAGGEDEMIERLDAAKAAAALKSVYDGFQPHQLELLRCECEADYKALAEKWGKSWWTVARAKAKLQHVVGARLMGKGLDAMPSWNDEVWRLVTADPANASPPPDTLAP